MAWQCAECDDSDAHALGGAKEARWGFVLCMLVLAAASARCFCAKCLWTVAGLQVERVELCVPLLDARTHAHVVRAPVKSGHLVWTAARCGRATVRDLRTNVTFSQICVSYGCRISMSPYGRRQIWMGCLGE